MSHAVTISEFTFIYNGDYSGNIRIFTRSAIMEATEPTLEIPIEVLEQFVANKGSYEQIAKLENAETHEILGGN